MTEADEFFILETAADIARLFPEPFTAVRIIGDGYTDLNGIEVPAGGEAWVVYPARFEGMGGGCLKAAITGHPVFDFDTEAEARALVAAIAEAVAAGAPT